MTKRQKPVGGKLNVAAERTGRILGQIARTFDGVRARHPHPIEEAREALTKGRKTVAKATKAAAKQTRKVVKLAKKTVTRRAARLKR